MGEHAGAGDPQDVPGEELGIEPGRARPGLGEAGGGIADEARDGVGTGRIGHRR
jgi:hypothetical protein